MIHNAPIKQLVHQDLTIEGCSRAAVQTYWRIAELRSPSTGICTWTITSSVATGSATS